MKARALIRSCAVVLLVAVGCDRPASVELGGDCTGSEQCKDPADTCMLVAGKRRCTMACSKERPCPKGYVCPVTDPSDRTAGSCLSAAEIGPDVVKAY
jgi:hypothetical protein